ncbi:invasion associated locus B family protein [Notoacmeibacter ruber]|nr:invasion associated locus B family protein [Notoacmeibacter ruber]
MTALTNAARRLVLAAGMLGLPAIAMAQDAPKTPGPNQWTKLCQTKDDQKSCQTQFVQIASGSGQLVTAVYIEELSKGSESKRGIRVVLPPERVLSAGVGLQVDSGQMQKLDYTICPLRPSPMCIAQAPITEQQINAFRKGGKLTVISLNPMGQKTPVTVTLKGFASAHDGEPIDASTLAAQQNAQSEDLKKKREEWVKKFREKQTGGESN